MKPVLLMLVCALLALACSSGAEDVSTTKQAVTCYSMDGLWLVENAPATDTLRARELVDKMMGGYPQRGTCRTPGSCATIPTSCTTSQCDAGACFGWSCHYSTLFTAEDGRIGFQLYGEPAVDAAFNDARFLSLTSGEQAELTAFRAAAAEFTNAYCTPW